MASPEQDLCLSRASFCPEKGQNYALARQKSISQLDGFQTRNLTTPNSKSDYPKLEIRLSKARSLTTENSVLEVRSIKLRDEKNKLSHERQKSCFMADHPVIVTTYGLAKNEYSSRIQRVITMDDLFL